MKIILLIIFFFFNTQCQFKGLKPGTSYKIEICAYSDPNNLIDSGTIIGETSEHCLFSVIFR